MSTRGYVVRGLAPGAVIHEERRETIADVVSTREAMIRAGATSVYLFAVSADGTETPLPTYEEALEQIGALRDAVDGAIGWHQTTGMRTAKGPELACIGLGGLRVLRGMLGGDR